jgi:nucleoside-diphosphate-sugar epimerase
MNLLRATFKQAPSTKRLIVARTPGERGPTNVYQASKAAAWSFCHMYAHQKQWPIVGAMIFQAYGPGQPSGTLIPSAFDAACQGRDFPMTSGVQQRDWVYVDDVMDALLALIASDVRPATTVDIGTGRATSVLDVVRHIYDLVDRGGRPRPGSLAQRPGENSRQIADAGMTFEKIGWRATVRLKDGLRRLLDTQR